MSKKRDVTQPSNGAAPLERGDVIQINEGESWGGCLAIVDEPKSFGCQAVVYGPTAGNQVGQFFTRLRTGSYTSLGVKAKMLRLL